MSAVVPLPMFPLQSVLVPHAVIQLHLFEPRYLALARDLARGVGRLGMVLIARGSEVGGDDDRYAVGTQARVTESVELPDGHWLMAVAGERRIDVRTWLPDDPYPLALVEERGDAPLDTVDLPLVDRAETSVRVTLDLLAQLGRPATPASVRLDDDPNVRSWQLCAIAPLVSLDVQRLLEVDGTAARMSLLATMADEQAQLLSQQLRGL
jgi:uncharacterized protein